MNLPLTSQVCSLLISQEIDLLHKERGIEFESLFYWSSYAMKFKEETHELLPEQDINPSFMEDYIPALSVAELGMLLPVVIDIRHPDNEFQKAREAMGENTIDAWLSFEKDLDDNFQVNYGDEGDVYLEGKKDKIKTKQTLVPFVTSTSSRMV